MKRILCLIENLGQGGAERQMIGLASMLSKDGNDVKIIIYNPNFFYLPLLKSTGVECEYIYKAKNRIRRIPEITKFIRKYKPDTVVSFLGNPSIVACCAKLRLRNFKLIVSERNTNLQVGWRDHIRFYLYRYADWIVPNSHSQNKFIETHYSSLANKTVTITNFVDTEFFCPPIEIKGKQSSNGVLRAVIVARICEQKNVKLFLNAVRRALDGGLNAHFDWYGLEFPPYSDECYDLVKTLNLQSHFQFHKQTNDVKAVYHNADVMILPSIYEGFPNVVCEAMSCGLPVLCSDVCDNGNIVRDNVNGYLFNPHDIDEIVDSMMKFYELPENKKTDMGRRSREFALEDFSKESFFDKYKKLIYD